MQIHFEGIFICTAIKKIIVVHVIINNLVFHIMKNISDLIIMIMTQ